MDDNGRIKEYEFNIERCLRITSFGGEKMNKKWLDSNGFTEDELTCQDALKAAERLYVLAIETGGRNFPRSVKSLSSLLSSFDVSLLKRNKESLEDLLRALEIFEQKTAEQMEKLNNYQPFLFSSRGDVAKLVSSFYNQGQEEVVVEWDKKIENFFKVSIERPSKSLLKKILSIKLINVFFVFSLGQGKEISFLMDSEACYSDNKINYPSMIFYKLSK